MGRECIEVEIEPVTGKEGEATGSQDLSQGMDDSMSHVLGAGTELKHGKNLGARVDSQSEPEHLCSAEGPGFAIRPIGGAGGGDGKRTARARFVRAHQLGTTRW
jgi:hypothetical protein